MMCDGNALCGPYVAGQVSEAVSESTERDSSNKLHDACAQAVAVDT